MRCILLTIIGLAWACAAFAGDIPVPSPRPNPPHDPVACGTRDFIVDKMSQGPMAPIAQREFGKGRFIQWLDAVRKINREAGKGDPIGYEPSAALSFIIVSGQSPYLEVYPVGLFTTTEGTAQLSCKKFIYRGDMALRIYGWLTTDAVVGDPEKEPASISGQDA